MFSIPKILLLIAIIVVVWYSFKLFGRNLQRGRGNIASSRRRQRVGEEDPLDMERCAVCGDFVSKETATHCADDDCPY